jgi:hypothetical protein
VGSNVNCSIFEKQCLQICSQYDFKFVTLIIYPGSLEAYAHQLDVRAHQAFKKHHRPPALLPVMITTFPLISGMPSVVQCTFPSTNSHKSLWYPSNLKFIVS